jgi:hypothetical protein
MSPRETLAPLVIIGSPRSGTTFLSHMVNRFFDMRVSRDNGTVLRFHRLLKHYEPLSDAGNLRRLISHLYADHYFQERVIARGLSLGEADLFERVHPRTYAALVAAAFGAAAESYQRTSWGYKRASMARSTSGNVNAVFPKARIVHIIRDAREVALSMRAASGALLERSWHFAATDWVSHVSSGRELAAEVGPQRYTEIRYEELMSSPADTMIRVLDFLGGGANRDASAARIRAEIDGLVKRDNTAKWRKQLPEGGVRQIERVAGPMLLELGYPLTAPDIAGKPIGLGERAYLQADRLLRNVLGVPLQGAWRYRIEGFKRAKRAVFDRTAEDNEGDED